MDVSEMHITCSASAYHLISAQDFPPAGLLSTVLTHVGTLLTEPTLYSNEGRVVGCRNTTDSSQTPGSCSSPGPSQHPVHYLHKHLPADLSAGGEPGSDPEKMLFKS